MITPGLPGYRGCPQETLAEIRGHFLNAPMTRKVDLQIVLKPGFPAELSVSAKREDGTLLRAQRRGMRVEEAKTAPLLEEEVRNQLKKTGNTPFSPGEISVSMEGRPFLPLGELNRLRRETLACLQEAFAGCAGPTRPGSHGPGGNSPWPVQMWTKPVGDGRPEGPTPEQSPSSDNGIVNFHVRVRNLAQALSALGNPRTKRLYLPASFALDGGERVDRVCSLRKEDVSLFLALPPILREREWDQSFLRELCLFLFAPENAAKFTGVQAQSLSGVAWLKRIGWTGKIALAEGIPLWNRPSLDTMERLCGFDSYLSPLELGRKELADLDPPRMEMYVYGRAPMMVSANCLRKTVFSCRRDNSGENRGGGNVRRDPTRRDPDACMDIALQDRRGLSFPVETDCMLCANTIYNSVPTSLHGYLGEITSWNVQALFFDFTDEAEESVTEILSLFEGQMGDGRGTVPAVRHPFPSAKTSSGEITPEKDPAGGNSPEAMFHGKYTTGHFKKAAP